MSYPMKIASLAGRGLGVIATRHIKPGAIILRERPFVRVNKSPGTPDALDNPRCQKFMDKILEKATQGEFDPRSEFETWPVDIVKAFEGILDEKANMAFEELDGEGKEIWMELEDVHFDSGSSGSSGSGGDGKRGGINKFADYDDSKAGNYDRPGGWGFGKNKTPGGVLRTNAMDDTENHANLYEKLSRFNHGCRPNAIRYSTDDTGGVAVVANRKIDEGEEVLISYMDDADEKPEEGAGKVLPLEERREHLMKQYRFHCTCELCTEQEEEEMKKRRRSRR